MKKPRILIVEDESSIAELIAVNLRHNGFEPIWAEDGAAAQREIDTLLPDLVLLDWMLPGLNGIEICRNIRLENKTVPIIFLTAKDTVDDAVFGLETGANDYIRKPFSFEELLARIRVLMRKNITELVVFSAAGIELNIEKHTVTKKGKAVELTQKEFSLLEYFLRNTGKVCRRTRIIEKVWDIHFDYDNSVIDVYINALRKKLDEPGQPSFITTVRGVGYKIESDE